MNIFDDQEVRRVAEQNSASTYCGIRLSELTREQLICALVSEASDAKSCRSAMNAAYVRHINDLADIAARRR